MPVEPRLVPAGGQTSRGVGAVLLTLTLGLLGLSMLFLPTLRSGFHQVLGDLGDSRFVNYLLEHSLRWLLRQPAHAQFWDPPFFYPVKNVLAWSEIMIGAAPFYWAWRTVFSAQSAFQAWMITCAALNYIVAVAFLRSGLRLKLEASAVGAFLLSFSSSRVAQLNHPQLLPNFYCFLAALALVHFMRSERAAARQLWIGVFFGAIVAQVYSGFYVAWFFCFGLAIFAIAALLQRDFRVLCLDRLRSHWMGILLAAGVSLLLLSPLLSHALRATSTVGWRDWEVVKSFVPRAPSWLYMGPRSWLYAWEARLPFFSRIDIPDEQTLGIGLVTPVLCLAGLVAARKTAWARSLLLAAVALGILLTAWPAGLRPWHAVFSWLPTASALRAVSRGGMVLLIPASIGLAALVDRRRSVWAAVAIAVICAAEQGNTMVSFDKDQAHQRAVAAASQVTAARCESFYLTHPASSEPDVFLHIDAMAASTLLGIPTINGYSGSFPEDFAELYSSKVSIPSDRPRLERGVADWSRAHDLDPASVCIIGPGAPEQ
jgi:hypothetical protein